MGLKTGACRGGGPALALPRVGRFFVVNAVELMVDGGLTGAPFGIPIFGTDLGRSVAGRSWQKLMRKEIRSEVDSGQTRSYRRHSRCRGLI
jgi:hypothetical protein